MRNLDATGPDLMYLWSTGEDTPTIQVNTSGIYTVTVTNDAGCSAAFSIMVTVVSVTSGLEDGIRIMVAPNPVTDIVRIAWSGSSTTSVHLMDKLGRVVLEDNTLVLDGATRTLNVANMPAGAYYLQIVGTRFVRKVRMIIKY
ncbi:MAG: T9SS type A sorting domain-containing protein [Saprospiraceae bacterium]|nr:T9SS type A sorting domain-containing protein [Saprospiraceae bacterium]